MLKPVTLSALAVVAASSGAQAERFNCPAVPLVAVDPKNQEAVWGVQPGMLTTLEARDASGRVIA